MRHYILPVYPYVFKSGNKTVIALVNRKRLLPEKNIKYEGQLGLFGGEAEGMESALETLHREIWLDPDGSELPSLSKDGIFGNTIVSLTEKYTVTPYLLKDNWDQLEYQRLASTCGEGVLDIILDDKTGWWNDKWLWPDMPSIVFGIFQAYQLPKEKE